VRLVAMESACPKARGSAVSGGVAGTLCKRSVKATLTVHCIE
jgi:hypothetical protein